jgi:hypothetical protein
MPTRPLLENSADVLSIFEDKKIHIKDAVHSCLKLIQVMKDMFSPNDVLSGGAAGWWLKRSSGA